MNLNLKFSGDIDTGQGMSEVSETVLGGDVCMDRREFLKTMGVDLAVLTIPFLFKRQKESEPENLSEEIIFEKLQDGLYFSQFKGPEVELGTRRVTVVKVDPKKFLFKPYRYDDSHMKALQVQNALVIDDWSKFLSAPVVFNAGQYRSWEFDRSYRGILRRDYKDIGDPGIRKGWKAFFVSGEGGRARILDSDDSSESKEINEYPNVIQSFMLFRGKKIRVRNSDWKANRLVVGQDRDGQLYIFHTDGAPTLWNLAKYLMKLPLNLERAMSMDGGYEAELSVKGKGSWYGQWETNDGGDISIPGARFYLPAVVGVFPKKSGK